MTMDKDENDDEKVCWITHAPMIEPVIAEDGFTYERAAIEEWYKGHGTSPILLEPMGPILRVPNSTAVCPMVVVYGVWHKYDPALDQVIEVHMPVAAGPGLPRRTYPLLHGPRHLGRHSFVPCDRVFDVELPAPRSGSFEVLVPYDQPLTSSVFSDVHHRLPEDMASFARYLALVCGQLAMELETKSMALCIRDIRATHRLLTQPYDRTMRYEISCHEFSLAMKARRDARQKQRHILMNWKQGDLSKKTQGYAVVGILYDYS
jgi:hypothetical protein